MKVLITGAAGNLGSLLSRHLATVGHEVRLTDRRVRRDLPARVEVMDLLNRDGCYRLVEGMDAVVHLGNHPIFPNGGDAQKIFAENVTMNTNVLQAMAEQGVGKVVFASSVQAINGDRSFSDPAGPVPPSMLPYLPLDGDVPGNPRNPYALSKHVTEQMLQYFAKTAGMSAVAVRFPLTIDKEHSHWLVRRAKRFGDTAATPYTLLDEAFAYLMAGDWARLIEAILAADLPGYRCYFPAAHGLSIPVALPKVIEQVFANVPLRRPVAEMRGLVDTSRITRETGWEPRELISFE